MVSLLIAASLVLLSDRSQVWDPDHISKKTTEVNEIAANGQPLQEKLNADDVDYNEFKGKRVLMMVHGFNTEADDAMVRYRQVRDQTASLKDESGQEWYDVLIGYLWPGGDRGFEYYSAEKNANELACRMRDHLCSLGAVASSVDLMAHSMGNRLVLEALKPLAMQDALIETFYSLAPAVDNESLEVHETYFNSTRQCKQIFVFHSEEDDVLKYLYTLAERDRALGYKGAENPSQVPLNVQFIDCTEFVDSHSGYFTATPFYQFIERQKKNQIPNAPNARLLADGFIEVFSK